ncbi:hypothetical protein PG990_003810 [Apiospora arundinis]
MFRSLSLPRMVNAIIPNTQFVTGFPISKLEFKYAATCSRGIWSNAFRPEERQIYRNKHGEEILFDRQYPPPGYEYVPAGNSFVTRQCRILAKETNEKIYAYYRLRSRKKVAKQCGLYVPRGIAADVESQYDARKEMADKERSQKLDKAYPNMPSKDKVKIGLLCNEQSAISKRRDTSLIVRRYVLDRYTAFNSLSWPESGTEAFAKANEEADKVLSIWRGKDPGI